MGGKTLSQDILSLHLGFEVFEFICHFGNDRHLVLLYRLRYHCEIRKLT